ncbi:hypothetical protein [Hyphomicrobium facile]|uniref:Uncharacterized protein n=1 Tax=Hyphomicrobium facile TaxID=51670 RepID=A0A1I7MWX1_9HYPH|nr:hypothetical protein [Hyphomicrobium facile]SFV26912.1 hypothetical protein SAMN04488557_0629 [Hyphomicrobium facile]
MQNTCYSSDELKKLAHIINEILTEARSHRPELSTDDVVQRLCAIADQGERDISKFRAAVMNQAA